MGFNVSESATSKHIAALLISTLCVIISSCDGSKFDDPTYSFLGVKNATYSSSGELNLEWDAVELSGEGALEPKYEVFIFRAEESFNLDFDKKSYFSNIVPIPSNLPKIQNKRLETKTTFAVINWNFEQGSGFYVYVRAINASDGKVISPKNLLQFAVERNAPTFDGLQDSEVSLDALGNIVLNWQPATSTVGNVRYLVFDSTSFVTPLTIVKDTNYTITNPIKGRTYNLAVRAQDDRGQDDNTEIVSYSIPDPSDKTPPVFLGLKSAEGISDKSILLKWDPSPSEDIAVYKIFYSNNLVSPISTTANAEKIITPLTEGTEYGFVVRAIDKSGNIESNSVIKMGTTLSYEVPEFSGLAQAAPRPGVEGLSKIKLTWAPAIFNPVHPHTVEGYLIYFAEADQDFPLVANIDSGNDPGKNEETILGLKEGTEYKFLVRAYYQDGEVAPKDIELNQKILIATTLSRKAPTFGGVVATELNRLESGNAVVDVKWSTPDADGILSGYKLTFEPGSCAAAFTGGAQVIDVGDPATLSQEVPNLTVGTKYKFKVNTFFQDQYQALIDANTKCLEFTPTLSPPMFDGVKEVVMQGNTTDFTQFTLAWDAPIGDCTRLEVSLSTAAFTPNFESPVKTINSCIATSVLLDGLTKDTTYYVQVRAVLENAGDVYISGQGAERTAITSIDIEDGDGLNQATLQNVPNATDQIELTWDLPGDDIGWTHIYIWRSFNVSETTAKSEVIATADNPAVAPSAIVFSTAKDNGDWTDTITTTLLDAQLGGYNCFLSRAVYYDRKNFVSSENTKTKCLKPTFVLPIIPAISEISYDASKYNSSGSEKNYGYLDFTFVTPPSGSIDEYHIFYSKFDDTFTFDFSEPIHKIAKDSPEDMGDTLSAKMNLSKINAGYYIVRWYSFGSTELDSNTATADSSGLDTQEISTEDVQFDSDGKILRIAFPKGGSDFTENIGTSSARVIWSDEADPSGNLSGTINEITLGFSRCDGAPANPCIFDFGVNGLNLPQWKPRFFQVIGYNGTQIFKSRVFAHANIPNGMVYIDSKLWPKESGNHSAKWEKFSYAIDKYEVTNTTSTFGNDVAKSIDTGVPTSNYSWNSAKTGCRNRTADYSIYTGDTEPRKIHLSTGVEWTTAAAGTPEQSTAGYCNISTRGLGVLAPNDTGDKDTSKCVSTYGVRNMYGNLLEVTDEILHDRNWLNFYGATDSKEVETLPIGIMDNDGIGAVQDWDNTLAVPRHSKRTGPWSLTDDKVQLNWSNNYVDQPTGSTVRVFHRGGSWNDTLMGRFVLYSTSNAGAASDYFGARCALAAPAPGKLVFKNDSEGDKARFKWKMWGEAPTVKIAFSKSALELTKWDGSNSGASILDSLYTPSGYAGCTDASYNSEGFEVLGDGLTTAGAFGLQGRCGIDMSGLEPWEKRYVKLHATNGFGEVFSDTYIIAKVPSGMVFVSAEDWPDKERHRVANELNESYSDPFDYAIDKYETTAVGSLENCASLTFPCTDPNMTGYLDSTGSEGTGYLNWYSFRQGCDNRTEYLGDTWAETSLPSSDTTGRRVHLATGKEWIVASYETPEVSGPQFCWTGTANNSVDGQVIPGYWHPGRQQDQGEENSTERCASRYGVRNMIGMNSEVTDGIVHNGAMYNFFSEESNGIDIEVPNTYSYFSGYTSKWDFDFALPLETSNSIDDALFHADKVFDRLTMSTSESRDGVLWRGGNMYNMAVEAGRFHFFIYEPDYKSSIGASRCALRAP